MHGLRGEVKELFRSRLFLGLREFRVSNCERNLVISELGVNPDGNWLFDNLGDGCEIVVEFLACLRVLLVLLGKVVSLGRELWALVGAAVGL